MANRGGCFCRKTELVSGALVIAGRIELLNSQTKKAEKHTKTIAASEFVIAVCLCDYVWEQRGGGR